MAAMAIPNHKAGPPHIAVLPTPGMGHLIPLAELAKRLVAHHGFSLTFITFSEFSSKAMAAYLASLPASISSVALPPLDLADVPPDARIETHISLALVRALPALRDILARLKASTNLVAFVADLFGADSFAVARSLSVPPYLFFPSNFVMLSLMLHLPALHNANPAEFCDQPPVKLPGIIPIPGEDILHPLQDKSNECYRWMVHHGETYRAAEAIIINTFDAIEPDAAAVMSKPEPGRPPVFTVGPLIRTGGAGEAKDESGCIKWLDEQPRGSVLYVSFGSGGRLTSEQTAELALGLEASGQRFLWVVRQPSDDDSSASYFNAHKGGAGCFGFLPEGFEERTKGVGLLVPAWAPQIEVLAHGSTGGFLSHCGWNSTLESMTHGVPMIAWPLYAEQRMNAVMLSEGVKVAIRPKGGEDGVVRRGEVERVVKELMEGEEGKKVRSKVREMQEAGVKALAEGGSSSNNLAQVARLWKGGEGGGGAGAV